MIKKVLFTLSLAGLFGVAANAQKYCGTDDIYRRNLVERPEIAEREAELNRQIQAYLAKADLSAFAKTTEDSSAMEYHVPIVFHIIHNYGSEYVTDAEIVKCVEDINKMYNKKNADTVDVIPPFKGLINNTNKRYIGNARITWHLATKDPNGNPTNGITRKRSVLTNFAGQLSKFDQWPPSSYMNVWLINTFGAGTGANVAAYAHFPADAESIPFWDGVISRAMYFNSDNTISHELGHTLSLMHPWGRTNDPGLLCGDDEVDDTPLTKGHVPPSTSNGCLILSAIYDTACLYTRNIPVGKLRIDSLKRDSPSYVVQIFKDTSTAKGIIFRSRTTSTLDTFSFYPTDTIGAEYKIGLTRNNVLIDSITVVTTVRNAPQRVAAKFKIPAADTNTYYKLRFIKNTGALRDTITPALASYPHGILGTIQITNPGSDNYYNFFYNWKITYGFYKIYSGATSDSLVDYPDTTNSQNVMDYTYCSKMFTNGQVERMRAVLTSTGTGSGSRGKLITVENRVKTGIMDSNAYPNPFVKTQAEFSVERGLNVSFLTTEPAYFLAADLGTSETAYSFVFKNRSWQATPTAINWTLTNGATVPTSTTTTSLTTKFKEPGWAKVTMVATNANGDNTFVDSVYVADPVAIDPIGYWQDFNDATENAKWPIFNYFNNRYKWEITNYGGTYDVSSIRYRSYDNRIALADLVVGDPTGDYDDFFSPAFDLSKLGATNGNINFMYSGAYAINNADLMKDVFEIAYSSNGGGTWTTLKTMKNAELQTVGSVPTSVREFTPAWDEWKPMSIDLRTTTGVIRDKRVYFRFRYKPSARPFGQYSFASGNNFYIDRINISDNKLSVNEMILGDKKVAVAPNPTNSNAFVLFQKANANVTIRVMDITGKLVYSVTEKVNSNNARIEIPATYLGAKGVYMVQITGDDNLNQTEKLIVY